MFKYEPHVFGESLRPVFFKPQNDSTFAAASIARHVLGQSKDYRGSSSSSSSSSRSSLLFVKLAPLLLLLLYSLGRLLLYSGRRSGLDSSLR